MSVELEDLAVAWNAIAALFMDMRADFGMKAVEMPEEHWSAAQRGREITVYLFVFHHSYRGYMQGVLEGMDAELYLGSEWDALYGPVYWFTFIREAERRLSALGVRSRGCAVGDFPLPGCRYTSLRNEAFVRVGKDLVYPPNESGWNAARQPNPLIEVIFFLRQLEKVSAHH